MIDLNSLAGSGFHVEMKKEEPKATKPSASSSSTKSIGAGLATAKKATTTTAPKPVVQSSYQKNLTVTAPTTTNKWYKGDAPTKSEMMGRILTINQTNPAEAQKAFTTYRTLQKDPASAFYSPYQSHTNRAVDELSALGFDTSKIDDSFYANNSWLKNYYTIDGATNTPKNPGAKASREEQAAYWFYQLDAAEATTKKAETEWAALQEECAHYANDPAHNYSDEEIANKIDWSNYPTLTKMETQAKAGYTVELNRAVNFDRDYLSGLTWAARNGSTGDIELDAANAALGTGKQWQADPKITAKLDPTNPDYSPYSVGSTMEKEGLYFGVYSFDQKWLDDNRDILASGDKTAINMYNSVYQAEQTTQAAEAELKAMQARADKYIDKYDDPEKAIKQLQRDLSEGDPTGQKYNTLKKMDESLRSGKIIDTTRAVDFRMADMEQYVRDGISKKRPGLADTTGDSTLNAAADERMDAASGVIEALGTEADKTRLESAPKAGYDSALAANAAMTPEEAKATIDLSISQQKKTYTEGYLALAPELNEYQNTQTRLANTRTQYDQLITQLGDKGAAVAYKPQDETTGTFDSTVGPLEIHTRWDDLYGRYMFDYAIDSDGEKYTEEDVEGLTVNDQEGYDFLLDYTSTMANERLAGVNAQFDAEQAMTPEEEELATTARQLEISMEDDQRYLDDHAEAYAATQKKVDDLNQQNMNAMSQIIAMGGDPSSILEGTAVADWLQQSVGNYEATQWSQWDPAESIQMAMSAEGSKPEEISSFIQQSRTSVEEELADVQFARKWIEDNDIQLSGDMQSNLDRKEAALQRNLKAFEAYDWQKEADYKELVEAGKKALYPNVEGVDNDWYRDIMGDPETGYYLGAMMMTDNELENFFYQYGKYGKKAADEYFNYLADDTYGVLPARGHQNVRDLMEELTKWGYGAGFVLANALEVLTVPTKLMGAGYSIAQTISGNEISPNSVFMAGNTLGGAVMESSSNRINDVFGEGTVGAWLAQAGYEIIINRLNSMVTGGLATGVFGEMEGVNPILKTFISTMPMAVGAAADEIQRAKTAGASDGQAMLLGGITLCAESVSEAITWGNIQEALGNGSLAEPRTWKEAIAKWLKEDGWEEALGESATDIVENMSDELIMGALSEHSRLVYEYRMLDYSPEEAELFARRDEAFGVLRTALISYLSPGLDVLTSQASRSRAMNRWARENFVDTSDLRAVRKYEQSLEEAAANREPGAFNFGDTQATESQPTEEAPVAEVPAAEPAPVTPEVVYQKDLALIDQMAATDDTTSKTAAVASIFTSGLQVDDVTMQEATDMANAAAMRVNTLFGDITIDLSMLINGSYVAGVDANLVKMGIQTAAIAGGISQVYQLMTGELFTQRSPDQQAQQIVEALTRDSADTNVQTAIQNTVREDRIAAAEQGLIRQGAAEALTTAQQTLDNAKAETVKAEEALQQKNDEMSAKKDAVVAAVEAQTKDAANPARTNEVTHAVSDMEKSAQVVAEYQQSLNNARQREATAKESYDTTSTKVMADLRANAIQAVDQQDQERAAARMQADAMKMEAAQQAAAQQLAEDEASGKLEEQDMDAKIKGAVDETYRNTTATPEEREELERRLRERADQIKTGQYDPNESVTGDKAVRILKKMGRKLGVAIVVGDTGPGRGKYANGVITLSNKLTVGQAVVETAMHEVTHSLEETNSYSTYANAAIQRKYGGENSAKYQAAIEQKIADYKAAGKDLSVEDARHELVADFTRTELASTDVIRRLLDDGLAGTIRNAIHNARQFFRNMKLTGEDKAQADYLRKAENALRKAINERKMTTTHPGAEQFSVAQLAKATGYTYVESKDAMYRKEDVDTNGNVVAGAKPVESITPEQVQNSPIGKMVTACMQLNPDAFRSFRRDANGELVLDENGNKIKGTPEETIASINKMFADLATLCCKYKTNELIWEIASSTLESQFSAIKDNSDPQYGTTVDFGTICAKTQAIVNQLSRDMVTLGRGLTQEEILDVYNDVYQSDLTVPCPVCYVFSRWMGVPSMLESIRSYQNTFLGEDKDGKITKSRDEIQQAVNNYIANARAAYGNKPNKSVNRSIGEFKTSAQNAIATQEQHRLDAAREINAYTTGNFKQLITYYENDLRDSNTALKRSKSKSAQKKYTGHINTVTKALESIKALQEIKGTPEYDAEIAKRLAKSQSAYDNAVKVKETKLGVLSEVEAYNWVTQVLCDFKKDANGNTVIEPDADGNYPLSEEYLAKGRVPDAILLDLNRTSEFTDYTATWKYRKTRGAGMGKAILPYSGASLGDSISGTTRWSAEQNPFYDTFVPKGNETAEQTAADAIKKAIERARAQNLVGGQRFQSTSDFRPEWGLDYMMTFLEQQCIGSKGQLYTKVIEAVDLLASAGIDCNLSLMGKGKGWHEDPVTHKKILDFSDTTGINYAEALEKTKQYDNVQMILVGFNDDHIKEAINNEDWGIDFVIPWHSSGNSDKTLNSLMASVGEESAESTDYTDYQTDKESPSITKEQKRLWAARVAILTGTIDNAFNDESMQKIMDGKGNEEFKKAFRGMTAEQIRTLIRENGYLSSLYDRFNVEGVDADCFGVHLPKSQADQIFPYEYWNKSLTKDRAKENGEAFVRYCAAFGRIPRFEQFSNETGYWKLLIDRKMYDNQGNYREQQTIDVTGTSIGQLPRSAKAKYNAASDPSLIAKYQEANRRFDERMGIAPDDSKRYDLEGSFSIGGDITTADIDQWLADNDTEYAKAIQSGDNELAKYDVEYAAQERGFDTDEIAYHGTDDFGFTEFDMERSQDEIFVAYTPSLSATYTHGGKESAISEASNVDAEVITPDMSSEEAARVATKRVKRVDKRAEVRPVGPESVNEAVSDLAKIPQYLKENGIDFTTVKSRYSLGYALQSLHYAVPSISAEDSMSDVVTKAIDTAAGYCDSGDIDSAMACLNGLYDITQHFGTEDSMQMAKQAFAKAKDFMDMDRGRLRELQNGNLFVIDANGDGKRKSYKSRLLLEYYVANLPKFGPGIYSFYTRPGKQLVIDAEGSNWNDISVPWDDSKSYKTREISEYARQNGYDSVRINNVFDFGGREGTRADGYGDIGIFLHQTDVKSADLATYDNDGNLIPPSQRFSDDTDFRYSIGGELTDADIDQLLTDDEGFFEYLMSLDRQDFFDNLGTNLPSLKTEDANEVADIAMRVSGLDRSGGTARLKTSTIDSWLAEYAATNKDYAQCYITYMNPGDFVDVTTHTQYSRDLIKNKEVTPLDVERMQELMPKSAIFLWIDEEEGKIISHEGRHRMQAMANAGITRAPVLLYDPTTKYSKVPQETIALRGQGGNWLSGTEDETNDTGLILSDIIPFSAGNRESIIERFGGEPQGPQDIQYQLGGDITDADIDQMLIDSGVVTPEQMTLAKTTTGEISSAYATRNRNKTGNNPDSANLKSGQHIINDLMGSLGMTADARNKKYLRSERKGTLGYTYSDEIVHIRDAQDVLTAAHELGHIFDREMSLQLLVPDMDALEKAYRTKVDPKFLDSYEREAVPRELMAEFTAIYVGDRTAAIDIAGQDVVDNFEAILEKRGWLKPLQQASAELRAWHNATAAAQAEAMLNMDIPKNKVDLSFDKLATGLFDRTQPLQQLTDAAKRAGIYSPENDPRTLKLAQRSMIDNLSNECLTGTMRDSRGNIVTDASGKPMGSLRDILNKVNIKDETTFNTLWLLYHARDRRAAAEQKAKEQFDEEGYTPTAEEFAARANDLEKKVFSNSVDIDSAITEIENAHPEYKGIINEAVKWYNTFMKTWLVDTGCMSKEDFQTMTDMYPHYIPTFRNDTEFDKVLQSAVGSMNQSTPTNPVKRAKGSTADIYNPVMGLCEYVQKYIGYQKQVESLRAFNEVAGKLWNADGYGIMGIAEPAQKSTFATDGRITKGQIRMNVETQMAAETQAGQMTQGAADRILSIIDSVSDVQHLMEKTADGDDVINVPMPDGSYASWTVYNKPVFEALVSAPAAKMPSWVKAVRGVTGFLCSMCTSRSLPFSGQNFISDSETAMNTGHTGLFRSFMPGYMVSQVAAGADYLKNKISEARGKETSQAYQDFHIFGLTGSRYLMKDRNSQKALRGELYNRSRVVDKLGMLNPIRVVENLSEFLEEVTRYNEFKHDRTDTSDYSELLVAGKNAREVTTDFSKSGSWENLSYAKAVIPFLGAQLQGVYKTLRMFSSENAGNRGKTAAKIVINSVVTNLVLAALKNLTWDDDDKEDYEQMTAYEMNKYWHIKLGDGQFLRLKRSQDSLIQFGDEFGTFLGNVFTGHGDTAWDGLVEVTKEIASNLVTSVDTVFDPFLDAANNKTWYGGSIDNAHMQNLAPMDRIDEKTTVFGRFLSNLSHMVGMDWTPKAWDYIIDQYTGSLGAIGKSAITNFVEGDNVAESVWNAVKDNIATKFAIDVAYTNNISTTFFNGRTQLQQIVQAANNGVRPSFCKGDDSTVSEAVAEAQRLNSKGGEVYAAYSEYSKLNKQMKAVQANPNLTDAEIELQSREIRKQMNKVLMDANDVLTEYRDKYCYSSENEAAMYNMANLLSTNNAAGLVEDPVESMPAVLKQSRYAAYSEEVYRSTGDDKYLPHPVEKPTFNGYAVDVKADPKVWDGWCEAYRDAYDEKIDDLLDEVGVPFESLSEEHKHNLLTEAHGAANSYARKWLKSEYEDLIPEKAEKENPLD